MKTVFLIILGYLVGSVPFALVIGKLFYKKDVRDFGSGNLGGSNTGRVLGSRAGVAVMALDLLKVSFIVLCGRLLQADDIGLAAGCVAAGIGHCFPVFAHFRGGKAVAAMYGFLFGLFAFEGRSCWYFFLPLAVFLVVLFIWKIVSVSSILSALAVTVFMWIHPETLPIRLAQIFFAVLIIVRHRSNLERISRHEENRIKWMGR